ncbi:MAG: heparinase II/III family protein [Runella zeae]
MKYLFVFLLASTTAIAQLKHLQHLKSVPNHPRIMLLKGEEKGIQKNIQNDPSWAKIHGVIIQECENMLTLAPLERIQIGRRLLDKSREALRRIFYLSYAYRVTQNPKYLERAELELLTVSKFSDWNPSHFLDVGEMTMAVAIGYDWLYHDLQKSSLPIIREAILKKGIEPSQDAKYNSWLKASHNWNQVCNAGMTYGALAIYEDQPELARQIIDRAIESIKLPMEDYKPDGAYPEGYSYWGYGTSFNVLFLSAIHRALGSEFGLSNERGFLNTATYFQNMVGTSGKTFNYSDAGSGTGGISPATFWFANRTKASSLLFLQKKAIENISASAGRDRILPAALIWGNGLRFDKVEVPQQLIWVGQGKNPVAMMRSSWTDPSAIYVGLKAGSPSVNHGHMDIGSFVMDANGERWSMDFGMQEYESLESKGVKLWGKEQEAERWHVYRYNNLAHSTLTFDNSYQRVDGYAKITSRINKPAFLGAITDMTAVYNNAAASAKRGVGIVDNKYVVVKDEILSNAKSTTVRWAMVTPAQVTPSGNGSAMLTQNGKSLQLKVLEPANVVVKTWSTQPSHDYDAPNPGTTLVGFEVTLPANSSQIINVLLIPEGISVNKETKIPSLKDWEK